MIKRLILPAFIALLPAPTGQIRAMEVMETPKLTLVEWRESIIKDSEARIQKDILDPMLGKERATVFSDLDLEVRAQRRQSSKEGSGSAEKYKEKGEKGQGMGNEWALPGVPKPRNITNVMEKPKPEAAIGQSAQQAKSEQEEFYAQDLVIKKFLVTIFHDPRLLSTKIKDVRELVVDAMAKYKLKPEDVFFKPMKREFKEHEWTDDLKEPRVYLPLLYALLLFLLLLFLFGPFARFLRRYVEAIVQKPAAEINVESLSLIHI